MNSKDLKFWKQLVEVSWDAGFMKDHALGAVLNIPFEVIAFDHEFIRMLYDLLPNKDIRSDIQNYTGILVKLAYKTDRIEYLKQEFGELINGN